MLLSLCRVVSFSHSKRSNFKKFLARLLYLQITLLYLQIWIHGGGFRWGSSVGFYEGRNFVAVGDVILVTINYRLSELGFLTTGDERIKGLYVFAFVFLKFMNNY